MRAASAARLRRRAAATFSRLIILHVRQSSRIVRCRNAENRSAAEESAPPHGRRRSRWRHEASASGRTRRGQTRLTRAPALELPPAPCPGDRGIGGVIGRPVAGEVAARHRHVFASGGHGICACWLARRHRGIALRRGLSCRDGTRRHAATPRRAAGRCAHAAHRRPSRRWLHACCRHRTVADAADLSLGRSTASISSCREAAPVANDEVSATATSDIRPAPPSRPDPLRPTRWADGGPRLSIMVPLIS